MVKLSNNHKTQRKAPETQQKFKSSEQQYELKTQTDQAL